MRSMRASVPPLWRTPSLSSAIPCSLWEMWISLAGHRFSRGICPGLDKEALNIYCLVLAFSLTILLVLTVLLILQTTCCRGSCAGHIAHATWCHFVFTGHLIRNRFCCRYLTSFCLLAYQFTL